MCFSSMRAPLVSRSDDRLPSAANCVFGFLSVRLAFLPKELRSKSRGLGRYRPPKLSLSGKLSIAKIGLYHNTVQAILRFSCQPSADPPPPRCKGRVTKQSSFCSSWVQADCLPVASERNSDRKSRIHFYSSAVISRFLWFFLQDGGRRHLGFKNFKF